MQIEKEDKVFWCVLVLVFISVMSLWMLNLYSLKDKDNATRGTFGDMFGGLNALFTGFAFTGVIATMLLQRRELKLQRKELADTREVLGGQKNQLEAQNQTLKKQNFESTFFQLLRVQNEIVNSMEILNPANHEKLASGRNCFLKYHHILNNQWHTINKKNKDMPEREKIKAAYLVFSQHPDTVMESYFHNLFHVITFIDRSEVADKNFYTDLVCAQFSKYELALLFYYCLSNQDSYNLKQIVEKYALLKNMPEELLSQQGTHKKLYPPAAYGESRLT